MFGPLTWYVKMQFFVNLKNQYTIFFEKEQSIYNMICILIAISSQIFKIGLEQVNLLEPEVKKEYV